MWDESIEVHIRSYSEGHIDCMVTGDRGRWRFTGIYGNPCAEQRRFTWELMRRLSGMEHGIDTAWLVGGDLNEILNDNEKEGGRPRPAAQMANFCDTIVYCCLNEVPKPDLGYTWFNKRKNQPIYERLDRVLVNREWRNMFKDTSTTLMDYYGSDHRPIVCSFENIDKRLTPGGGRRFFFEDKWLLEKHIVPDFICEWDLLRSLPDLTAKLAGCRNFLQQWAKKNVNSNEKTLDSMRRNRQELMRKTEGKTTHIDLLELSKKIEHAEEVEAVHWKQRARLNWLMNGDRNTSVFHAQASKRRAKNEIKELEDESGQVVYREEDKAKIIEGYFAQLFQTSQPTDEDMEGVTRTIKQKVSAEVRSRG